MELNSYSLGIEAISLASKIVALVFGYKALKLGSKIAMDGILHSMNESNKSIRNFGLGLGIILLIVSGKFLFKVFEIRTPIQIDVSGKFSPTEATDEASIEESPSDIGNERAIGQESISDRGDNE